MGPLAGIRIVELSGIGPAPFCGMMLADMGAQVLSVERTLAASDQGDPLQRNRVRIALDLKTEQGVAALLELIARADAVFEGYRPGVAERLGFGPDVCLGRNPRLVYGRMTGWGQEGPLAHAAGHDINYIALSGALYGLGRAGGKPIPPLNLLGDFGGGGMLLAFGMVCALLEAQRSGRGQVVDAAMIDGSLALMAMFIGMQRRGMGIDGVGTHFLAGAAHYYTTYETSDGKFVAIAALEPQFYAELVAKLGLDAGEFGDAGLMGPRGRDPQVWAALQGKLATVFKSKTRDEWCALLEGSDTCFAPVLSLDEARMHAHNVARKAFVVVDGFAQNAPAPRFSRCVPDAPQPARSDRETLSALLREWRLDEAPLAAVLDAARIKPEVD